MVNDPVEEVRQEMAGRMAAQFNVPIELILNDPAMSYTNVSALIQLEPEDHMDYLHHALVRGMVRGMQDTDETEPLEEIARRQALKLNGIQIVMVSLVEYPTDRDALKAIHDILAGNAPRGIAPVPD